MLRISLQGELRVELDGQALAPIASGRARSLLAWLAYHPGMHPRTRVAAVFWPDVLDSSARSSLRTTLTTLRRELGEGAAERVTADRERVGIVDGEALWIDLREIDRLTAAGRHADALALCTDEPLLADLDDDWVLDARQAHRERVGELLVALGEGAEAAGDVDAALRHARRRLELDPLSEDAARVLMRRMAESGDRAAAITAYEAFREALRRELGITPSRETRALAEQLRVEAHPAGRGAAPPPLPPALAHGAGTPLVGRQESLAALRRHWRNARDGSSVLVTVDGGAGSGKTRLLAELAEEARGDGATVLAGRCLEEAVSFAPFSEALRPYAVRSAEGLPAWVLAELARLLPDLEPDAAPLEGAPQDARHRLFEAVAAALGHAARRAPVLLVVEDLHWADGATLGMLAHTIRTLSWAPLLVAGSLRDEEAGSNKPLAALLGDLRRERRHARVALGGLSEDETADLASTWLGTPPPPALTAAVHGRTGGNPLFVEELVRHLVESHPGRQPSELVAAARADVPEGVRSVIDRRLARLSEPAGEAVRVAAVAGEDFALADVAAACDTVDDALAGSLDEAVAAGLIDEAAQPGQYHFAHALVREAVIAALGGTRRALLHRRLAEVIEMRSGDRRLPELARHLLDARPLVDAGRAAASALRAAEQALRALAYEDAAELLDRALAGELEGRDPLRAELLLALADARQRMGDAPSGARRLDEAARLARTLGSAELLARAALGSAGLAVSVGPVRDDVQALLEEALAALPEDSELRPRLLARLAIEVYYAPPATLRERLSEEALETGRRIGGRALLEALGGRRVALWSPAHTEERLAIADELVAAAREAGEREAELQGVNWRVADLFELGDLDAARAAIADHARLAAELRLPAYDWYVPMWRAALAILANRLDQARRLSEEGARIGRAAHDDNAELLFEVQRNGIDGAAGHMSDADYAGMARRAESSPAGGAWRAALLARTLVRGDTDGAARALPGEVAALASAPLDTNWLYTATTLGMLAAQLRDERAAAELYRLLRPYGHRVVTVGRVCWCTGSASLALGMLAVTSGDRRAANVHLEEAVRRNDALGAVVYAAAARQALAGVIEDAARAAELRRDAEAAATGIGMALPDRLLWQT